ncbi:thiolase-like domain-containing protein [Variovorax paradoxus B4]|uniref:Thiolase-like domain-containing protein n=1 Tax=Variovorax paradoxus B4 TaxID=1246301 RepID=T1X5M2_VARPD|nr:thiolase-like domain-containing protein [Variovorax paradoxus]AGU47746.1 thiolase-like domain-containing protein [Variovorax paradoxus B4]
MNHIPPMPIAIRRTGLVTSVGLSAPASCAAIRAKLTNPVETRFIDAEGERIMAHEVALEKPWRGRAKLARMAALAARECLADVAPDLWDEIPLLLCVAERERPGRLAGLDDLLFTDLQDLLGARFSADSLVVAHGRVGALVAFSRAQRLIGSDGVANVLVVAADSLLSWPTLSAYERGYRLLTAGNSNGFIPGEGAGALLLGRPGGDGLLCTGIGFGMEKAHIDSDEPLRADGLSAAIEAALAQARCAMHEIDYRITDLSGEQYYFKEATLALARTLRQRKESFDLWHPAECIGEAGAVAGVAALAVAQAACRGGYAPGPDVLVHMANDAGQRAAAVMRFDAEGCAT